MQLLLSNTNVNILFHITDNELNISFKCFCVNRISLNTKQIHKYIKSPNNNSNFAGAHYIYIYIYIYICVCVCVCA